MMGENVILIGMSGAGKSTLGVLLAKALGKSFTDTDLLIQEKEGRLLQEILDTNGMTYFLNVEETIVATAKFSNCVAATGGSVVYSEKAMHHLKQNGRVVYLLVEFEELSRRLTDMTTRGIVFRSKGDLRSVYEERLPLYEKYADVTVSCTGRSIEESLREIITFLQK